MNQNFESKARDLAESVYEANDRFEKVVEIIEKALRSVHDEAYDFGYAEACSHMVCCGLDNIADKVKEIRFKEKGPKTS